MKSEWIHKILEADKEISQEDILALFRFQYGNNTLYKQFADALCIDPSKVDTITQIPFLPVQFFKSHEITTTSFLPEAVFESSGTTGSVNSRHLVREPDVYRRAFTRGFRGCYGQPSDWCIIGLLPSYLERSHSSLVVMVNELIKLSGHAKSGFYLNEYEVLNDTLQVLEKAGQKTWLIGVSFALLDFAEQYPAHLRH
ncbi:MAG: acyl transferase, partial [Chitinophagaceae bacterium]|nr:acyl transferase [Chitinophagaceae bacterium]